MGRSIDPHFGQSGGETSLQIFCGIFIEKFGLFFGHKYNAICCTTVHCTMSNIVHCTLYNSTYPAPPRIGGGGTASPVAVW